MYSRMSEGRESRARKQEQGQRHHLKRLVGRYLAVLKKEVLYRAAKFSADCFYSLK